MGWQLLFAGSVPKDCAFPESNEDRLDADPHSRVYVMSDGASESFNSALWSEILVSSAANHPPNSRYGRWLKQAVSSYKQRIPVSELSWSKQAAFDRGSFASILVAELHDSSVTIFAIGDTTAILVEDGNVIHTFPYKEADEFRQRPHLLSTIISRHNSQFFRQALRSLVRKKRVAEESVCTTNWPTQETRRYILICVTDALAEWLMRSDEKSEARLNAVLAVRTNEGLLQLVLDARAVDGMRKDDSSLITLSQEHVTSNT